MLSCSYKYVQRLYGVLGFKNLMILKHQRNYNSITQWNVLTKYYQMNDINVFR